MAIVYEPSMAERFENAVSQDNYTKASLETLKELGDTMIKDAFISSYSYGFSKGMEVEFPTTVKALLPYLVVKENKYAPRKKDGSRPKEYILILQTAYHSNRDNWFWKEWNLGFLASHINIYQYNGIPTGNIFVEASACSPAGTLNIMEELQTKGLKSLRDVLEYLKGKRIRCVGLNNEWVKKNQISKTCEREYIPQFEIVGDGVGYCFSKNICTGILHHSKETCGTLKIPYVNVDNNGAPYLVDVIDNAAFCNCTAIETIDFSVVKEIRRGAFYGCSRLKELDLRKIEWIGENAFENCTGLESVMLNPEMQFIMEETFKGCAALKSCKWSDIPNHRLTRIGAGAFSGCSRLSQFEIPESVVEIDNYAFKNCISLSRIIIPEGVKRLGAGAFKGCVNLESISIPNSVTDIAKDAFQGCYKLSL